MYQKATRTHDATEQISFEIRLLIYNGKTKRNEFSFSKQKMEFDKTDDLIWIECTSRWSVKIESRLESLKEKIDLSSEMENVFLDKRKIKLLFEYINETKKKLIEFLMTEWVISSRNRSELL